MNPALRPRPGTCAGHFLAFFSSLISRATFCWLCLLLVVTAGSVKAQSIQYTQHKPDQSLRSDARVDPSTLGMSLQIPLGSYPGRAGTDVPVGLYYNSKVWRIEFDDFVNGNMSSCINNPNVEAGTECYTTTNALYAEKSVAGWTFGSTFPSIESGGERYRSDGGASPDNNPGSGYYIARLTVRFPDGSTHEMRRSDAVLSGADPGTGTYYAVDSSRLKYVSAQPGTGALYLPDGSHYDFSNWSATQYIDRNGNILTATTDTLGRQIITPSFHNGWAHTETHSIPGVNGVPLSYTFELQQLSDVLEPDLVTGVVPVLHRLGDMDKFGNNVYSLSLFTSEPEGRVINPSTFNPVVLRRITLPNGTSYIFSYNEYGEIARVIYPTGGYERYRYGFILPLAAMSSPYAQANRGVVERRVSATGSVSEEATWQYNSTGTAVQSIAPNGTRTVRLLHAGATFGTVVFGFDDPRAGMIYDESVYAPQSQGGAMLRRTLTKWEYTGPTSGGQATAKRDPRVTKRIDILLDTGGDALAATTELTYDADLNLISTKLYDYSFVDQTTAQNADIASIPNGTLLLRTEEATFLVNDPNIDAGLRAAYRARNLLASPTSTRIKEGNNIVAQGSIGYDEGSYPLLTYGSVTSWSDPATNLRGNPTTVSKWLDTTNSYLQMHVQYDQLGNVRNAWDAKGNLSQISYSSSYAYAYPTQTISAVPDPSGVYGSNTSLVASSVYDFSTGLVTSTTDANGKTTTFEYNDVLDRLTRVNLPDGGATTHLYVDAHQCGAFVETKTLLDSSPERWTDSWQFFDGLGRAYLAESLENQDPSNPYLRVDTQYDSTGRAYRISSPYRTTGCTSTVNPSGRWTETTFDALSRPAQVKTTADNAVVTTSYSGNTVTVSDQAGKTRRSITDALGRLTRVDEPDANGNLGDAATPVQATRYLYDALGNLRKVDQGGQFRYFMYDSLGRLIRAKNPEQDAGSIASNLTDSVTGNTQWSIAYAYDDNGNLVTRIDARNITTNYGYDALNRNIYATYSDGTPASYRYYDGATNGRGRLYWDQSVGVFANVYLAYDDVGRPTQYRQRFWVNGNWGDNFTTTASYDKAGHVLTETYPSNHALNYNYDSAGRLADKDAQHLAFTGNLGDGTPRTYANELQYTAMGGLQQEKFGTDTPLYHKQRFNVRGQLWDMRASTVSFASDPANGDRGAIVNYYSSGFTQGGSGTDNNGNLLRQESYIPGSSYFQDNFAYDSLNRLTSISEKLNGTGSDSFKQAYSFDRWGNRTIDQMNTSGSVPRVAFNVDSSTNRLAVPTGQTGTMTFDKAGNLTTDSYTGQGGRSYDAENRMTQAQGGISSGWQYYTYDGDGHRVKRKVDNVETWQVYGLGGELIAEYPANGSPSTPSKEYGYRDGQLLVTADAPQTTFNRYAYRRTITIDHTKVPNTDQSNFPMLVSGTYSYLATSSNGGNVQSASGYDVIFTSDSSCTTKLNHEVETYNATTGAVNYWVKVPTVSHTSDTTIYMCYGNSSISTDQSNRTAVWDSNFKGVWHLSDNAADTTVADSTAANNGTNQANTSTKTGTGKDARALSYNGSSDYTDLGSNVGNYGTADSFTIEAWVNPALDSQNEAIYANGFALAGYHIRMTTGNRVRMIVFSDGLDYSGRDSSVLSAGWHHVVGIWKGSGTPDVYVDGALDNSATITGGTLGSISTTAHALIGATPESSYRSYFNGGIDEMRSSKTARSADWIKTEYNNQNSPATFYSISSASGYVASVHWLVSDQLGTPRMIFDQSGSLANVSRHDYLPFGQELFAGIGGRTLEYTASDNVRQKFTQKERDSETGLDYFGARYFASTQGRFTSVDPVAGSCFNPQSLNAYSYAWNNPLVLTDPTGMTVSWEDSEHKKKKDEAEARTEAQRKYEKHIQDLLNSKSAKEHAEGQKLQGQYERLQKSAITFHVVKKNPNDASSGELTYAGQEGHLYINLKGDSSEYGALTDIQKLAHEFTHGEQFLDGKIGFITSDGKHWHGSRDDLPDEAEAFIAGFDAQPLDPAQRNNKFLNDVEAARSFGLNAVIDVLDREGPYKGRNRHQNIFTDRPVNVYAVPRKK
jgi:RHS repeat-associated protein